MISEKPPSAGRTEPEVVAGSRERQAVVRHRLGARLRSIREARSMRLEDVAFALLRFTDPASPDVACQPGPAGRVTRTTREADLTDLNATFDSLATSALPPGESRI